MKRFRIISAGSVCLVVVLAGNTFADAEKTKAVKTKKDQTAAVIDAFVTAIKNDTKVDAGIRRKVLQSVEKLRKNKETRDFALTEGLRELSAEFRKALELLGAEDFKSAIAVLKPLAGSKNPFLAAESRYYLARAFMLQEKYELAIPHLEKIDRELASKTLRAGECLFLKGMAQLHLLKRKAAGADLTKFLKRYPDAPERLRIAAWRQLEVLRSIELGSLPDIHQHMQFSRRKLALENSGDETRKVQKKIVAMLDKMIKEAEKKGGS